MNAFNKNGYPQEESQNPLKLILSRQISNPRSALTENIFQGLCIRWLFTLFDIFRTFFQDFPDLFMRNWFDDPFSLSLFGNGPQAQVLFLLMNLNDFLFYGFRNASFSSFGFVSNNGLLPSSLEVLIAYLPDCWAGYLQFLLNLSGTEALIQQE